MLITVVASNNSICGADVCLFF
uniref:Uncharacterized protein n=1 Tax=Lepeophtheirus salmonis TaxID=72036 RepID=A0A0K2T4A0_LEPSM